MKSLLFQLVFLVAVIAPFLAPYLVFDQYFGLNQPWPSLVGFVGLSVAFSLFAKWNSRELERENAIVETLSDSILGEVTCRRDSWEATIAMESGTLLVTGITPRPTDQQRQTTVAVIARFPSFLDVSTEAARDVMGSDGADVVTFDLQVESIWVDESEVGTFSMTFEVPRFSQLLQWGLCVYFVNYRVESAEALH